MKKSLLLIFTIFQVAILSGQSCSEELLEQRSIRAITTDSNIKWEAQKHQVFINPDCIQNDKLIIHLVGSFDNPANTTYFPSLAANNGFKVINLKYLNNKAAKSVCGNSSDPDCYYGYRQEIIFGIESNSSVDVDMDNSIINRTEKLLVYLTETYPSENWDNFLTTSNEINWSQIIVSGHSQGGGHAAFIAKLFLVNRVLMFASPNDISDFFSAPANWLSSESVTPDSNYFAFGNLNDDVVDFNKQYENWAVMNLLTDSDSTNVDHTVCNFNNSHVLYTRHDTSSIISSSHNNVIIDAFTPIIAGKPTFTPVWKFMMGICESLTSSYESTEYFSSLKIFPNPTSSRVMLESSEQIRKIEIYSLSGTLLKSVLPFKNYFELDIDSYKGVILIKTILEGSSVEINKLVIID